MRWDLTEYLLKGLYLGLLTTVALQGLAWEKLIPVLVFSLIGLAMALAAAAYYKLREGVTTRGRAVGFLLFLFLENPGRVYAGLVVGLALGVSVAVRGEDLDWKLVAPSFAGLALGALLYRLRMVRDPAIRKYLGWGVVLVLIGAPVAALTWSPLPPQEEFMLGVLMLAGIPGFWLLGFSSLVEESEFEIAVLCGALGVGLWILGKAYYPDLKIVPLVVPLAVYYLYSRHILPGLRVFKHALRGLSYNQMGQYRPALISLSRALQLNPNYALAREQMWDVHRRLDVDVLQKEPDVLPLINYRLCLERVGMLLLKDRPQPNDLDEATRLLGLIRDQRPDLEPACQYWRTVAALHRRDYEGAASDLNALLTAEVDSDARQSVLFVAWRLAAALHPEMKRKVGDPLLADPKYRFAAIAAVESQIAVDPKDEAAWELKRLLYSPLTFADYVNVVGDNPAVAGFDHQYAREVGFALLGDPNNWQRGCDFLQMAARGLPTLAPALIIEVGRTHEKHGIADAKWTWYRDAIQLGRKVGAKNLSVEDRKLLFAVTKAVGDRAKGQDDVDAALDAYKYYADNALAEGGGALETYRTLADLFEKKKDVWMALHCTEHALTYNSSDPDLLARKDKYYYSVAPEDLKKRAENLPKWFDVDYCVRQSSTVLNQFRGGDLSLLDWASHLADLAQIARPGSIQTRLVRARILRIRGETAEATTLLENIRQNRPERFGGEDEEEAWYLAHRILGDLYLETKPDQAVQCFQEYKKSTKAGADTSYKMGRGFESLGDFARALRCYEDVMVYPDHPLYYEARDAIDRVKRGARQQPA